MKKFLFALLLVLMPSAIVQAQNNIVYAEYYIDALKDRGQGTPITIGSPSGDVTLDFNVPLSSVPSGFHILYYRVMAADCTWSIPQAKPFVREAVSPTDPVPDIVSAEYYFDSDPGRGGGTSISFSAAADLTTQFSAGIGALTNGFHILYTRVRDANGQWSIPKAKPFVREAVSPTDPVPDIVFAEYYFDSDPGRGGGTSISFSAAADLTTQFSAGIGALTNGFHILYTRVRDANGQWSIPQAKPFVKEAVSPSDPVPDIVSAEYYFDSDPGRGGGTSISFSAAADLTTQFSAGIGALTNGFHILYTRVRDANGQWSIPQAKPFVREAVSPTDPVPDIVFAEYYFDNDPGRGGGTSISFSAAADLTTQFSAGIGALTNGFHILYTRVRDANGQWSIPQAKPFVKEASSQADVPANITSIQYFYAKKGQKTGSYSYSSFTPLSDANVYMLADLSALSIDSTYELHLIANDANGQKSLEFVHSFQVKSSVPDSMPSVTSTISDQTLAEDFGSLYIANLKNIFFDFDAFFWDSLRYSVSVSPATVSASITNDTLSLTSINNAADTAIVTVTATDDSGKTASTSFTVAVTQVLDPITLQTTLPDSTLSEDFGKIFFSKLSDVFLNVDPDPLLFSVHALSAGATPLLSSDSLYLRDSLNTAATVTIAVSATNGTYSAADTFIVTVTPVNDAPVLVSALRDTSLNEDFGKALIAKLSGSFSDIDNVSLNYSDSALAAGVSVSVSNDSIFAQSAANFFGNVDIRVTASDGALSVADTLMLTVNAVNDAPVLVTALRDTSLVQNFGRKFIRKLSNNFSDVDNVSLTYFSSALTSGVTPSVSSDSLYLNSVTNFFGTVDVIVSATDNGSLSAADTFRATVQIIPLTLSISVLQNPVLSKYADVIVVGDTALQTAPLVKVIVGNGSSDITMTSVNAWVYKGEVQFTQIGPHKLRVSATSVLGASKSDSIQYNVSLAKPDLSASIGSTDGKAILNISPKTLSKETYLMSWQEASVYHFGPPVELQKPAELTITYDPMTYPDAGKLFIYVENDGNWTALRSQVYPASNSIKAKINSLGNFKILLDKDYQGTNVVPTSYALKQNYPNPFNPTTTIIYDLAEDAKMTLVIYNILGQKVRTMFQGNQLAGTYSMIWDGRNDQGRQVASSIYLYRIDAGRFVQTKKMTLIK